MSEVQQEGLKFSLADKLRRQESDSELEDLASAAKSASVASFQYSQKEDGDNPGEEADQVPDMPGTDIFERSRGNSKAVKKLAGTVSSAEEFFRGQPKLVPNPALTAKK